MVNVVHRPARFAVAIALVVGLCATLVPGRSEAYYAPSTNDHYLYGGMYTGDFWTRGDALTSAGSWAGRKMTFSGWFHDLTEDPAATKHLFELAWKAQATPFANVQVNASSADIASGKFDWAINRWRDALKSWLDQGGGRSAIIAPLQEMNGSWTPWGCDPTSFKAAYRRIVNAFRSAGINETKVRWAYAPNGWSDPKCPGRLADYYPGDDVVDVIGISAYNYGPKGYYGWESPDRVFGPYLNELRGFAAHKPYMIAQTGTAPTGGDRDQWLRDMFAFLTADPNVVGFVYFNIDKSSAGGNEWDWRVYYGGNSGAAGFQQGMSSNKTAYAWPLRSWFRPGPLTFGNVDRAAGNNRVETAVEISKRTFGSAPAAVLAPQGSYGQALLGAPLAAKVGGPVLLSAQDHLPDVVLAEIQRLGASKVYLVGGHGDLSAAVESRLHGAGKTTERIDGGNIFDVSRKVAGLVGGQEAYVVEGWNPDPNRGWPDAISVSGLAAFQQRPILFVERDRLPPETLQAIRDLRLRAARIVGGTVAVSEEVARSIAAENVNVQRTGGISRYETSRMVADLAASSGMSPARTWLATGGNYPDALAAGPAVAKDGGVLLLAHGQNMEGSTWARDWLRGHSIHRVRLIGGWVALSDHIAGEAYGVAAP